MNAPRSDAEVDALIALAMQRIDDDAPDYVEPLHALDSPLALGVLAQRGQPLFAELRKLRPVPLWVRDHAELALKQKRVGVLDGAICQLAPGTASLQPEGRECWLEVDSEGAESALRGLSAGWGLVVSGDLRRVSFPLLRRAAPLRALGAILGGPPLPLNTRLDLVVVERLDQRPDQGIGARVLESVQAPHALSLAPESAPSVGVVCDGKSALSWALRLASIRRPKAPGR